MVSFRQSRRSPRTVDEHLAAAQAMKYAGERRDLYASEIAQRRRAECALAELRGSYAKTVRALAAALELRDYATGGHAERVTKLVLALARQVAPDPRGGSAAAYDAMTNDRPYRAALPVSDALDEIARRAGNQFDPSPTEPFFLLAAEDVA